MIEIIPLAAAALLVAIFNSVIGPTGGAFIALVSLIIAGPAAIVLHAVAGLFSAISRAFMLRRFIDKRLLFVVILASIPSIPLGTAAIKSFAPWIWSVTIGAYLVIYGLTTAIQKWIANAKTTVVPAFLSSTASFFIGTGGILINPVVVERSRSPEESIANQAAIVSFQHLLKIGVFSLAGFAWFSYSTELGALITGVFIGNIIGTKLLERFDLSRHRPLQRWGLVAVGIILVGRGIYSAVIG